MAIVVGVIVVLAMSMRAIATFWTDYLWFDDLDFGSIWTRLLSARISLAVAATVIFFLIAVINLLLTEKFTPSLKSISMDDEVLERYQSAVGGRQRLLIVLVSLGVALIPGISAAGEWQNWILFRMGGSFGVSDPQFNTDIGFYVFKLPFLSLVVDWLFGFLLVTIALVLALYYLNGAIRIQNKGERMSSTAKAHLSVLLALLALTKAADYWLQRFELTFQQRDPFDGAGYTAVNATLPALQLLILVALFAALLFVINIRRRGWMLPAMAIALWAITSVVVAAIYPAFVQRFQVSPAELNKEEPYIERNISATRTAMGISDVETSDLNYDPDLTREDLEGQQSNLDNARLLDPALIKPTIQALEFGREYYSFKDVDVDRYSMDSEDPTTKTPTIISSRELKLSGVESPTWEKTHLVFTHGYAVAAAPANTSNSRGEPDFIVGDIPARVRDIGALDRPEIYVGEGMEGYSIVGTDQQELSSDDLTTIYEGSTGVPVNSFFRKAAFSLRFGEIDPLISDLLTDDSKVIYQRDAVERVKTIAPFLEVAGDPYPVLVDGRIVYVLDGYTSTTNYPYAQTLDGAAIGEAELGTFNYLRNSVKAVVDAYDGTVDLYLSDTLYGEEDPIVRAYAKAFPDLFSEDMPAPLAEHLRYPEGLFKTQTELWGRYHQDVPATFFSNSDRWSIAQAPPSDASPVAAVAANADGTESGTQQFGRIDPYYQMIELEPGEEPEFVLTRPFVLASSDDSGRNLTAIMVADNDPGTYGQLSEVVISARDDPETGAATRVDGTLQASEKISTYPPVSQYQTVVGQRGSSVQFGNLLILPFSDSLLYVRPVYARQENSGLNTLQRVAVTSGGLVGFGSTLEEAIDDMFETDESGEVGINTDPDAPDPAAADTTDPETTTPPETTIDPVDGTPEELLAQADRLFTKADEALANGDLGEYDSLVDEARVLLKSALAALDGSSG